VTATFVFPFRMKCKSFYDACLHQIFYYLNIEPFYNAFRLVPKFIVAHAEQRKLLARAD
jgi:hypothetical protein